MKSISLKSVLRTRVKSNNLLLNGSNFELHEDFTDLYRGGIVNSNTVENIEGSNSLSLRNSGGLFTLVGNALTWADCILTRRATITGNIFPPKEQSLG